MKYLSHHVEQTCISVNRVFLVGIAFADQRPGCPKYLEPTCDLVILCAAPWVFPSEEGTIQCNTVHYIMAPRLLPAGL